MHILDVISYQGSNDVLVYRSPKTDFTNYSRLIVHESQVAYVYLDGKMTGPYGPGDYTMDTGNIPILEKFVRIPYGGEAPFKAEVYFINESIALNRLWGTQERVCMWDQTYGRSREIGAHGMVNLCIKNPRQIMQKIVGTENQLTTAQFLDCFRRGISIEARKFIAQVMALPDMNFMLFRQRLSEFSEELKQRICHCFEDCGVEINDFVIREVVDFMEDKAQENPGLHCTIRSEPVQSDKKDNNVDEKEWSERLEMLKELRENGLISDEEYKTRSERLEMLKKLRENGLISDEQYKTMTMKILEQI